MAPADLAPLLSGCKALAAGLQTAVTTAIPQLVVRVRVLDARLEIDLCTQGASTAFALPLAANAPPVLTPTSAVRLTRTGRAIRLVHAGGGVAVASESDLAFARLVAKAREWWWRISEEGAIPSAIAAEEQVTKSYVARVLRLAFLPPAVVEAILDGRLKAGIDGSALLQTDAIALGWEEQAAMMVAC